MTTTETTVSVGDRVRLTKAIYDHGEDHHPPGWLAMAGEVLVVRHLGSNGGTGAVAVSHEDVTDNAFWISRDEYEPHNDRVEGRDAASSRRVPSHDELGVAVPSAPTFGKD